MCSAERGTGPIGAVAMLFMWLLVELKVPDGSSAKRSCSGLRGARTQ